MFLYNELRETPNVIIENIYREATFTWLNDDGVFQREKDVRGREPKFRWFE